MFSAPYSNSMFRFTPPGAVNSPIAGMSPWAMQGLQGLGSSGLDNLNAGLQDAQAGGMRVNVGYQTPQPTRGQQHLRRARYNPVQDGLMQAAPRRTFRS